MNRTLRRAILAIWGINALFAVFLFFQALLSSEPYIDRWVALIAFPASLFLYFLYWRGKEIALPLNVVLATILTGFVVPLEQLSHIQILPLYILVPPILALILADALWILISSLAMWVILWLRMGFTGFIVEPQAFVAYIIAVAGLFLARIVSDGLRKEANSNALLATRQADELARSRANLQAVIENTDDYFWSVDPEYHLVAFNSNFQEAMKIILGHEILPGESILDSGYPDDMRQHYRDCYERALKGEQFKSEIPLDLSDGLIYIENSFNPIFDKDDTVTGIVVQARDITERKEIETTLEEHVKQRTAQLEAANRELESFSYTVSHDLRAPLRAIDGYSSLLLEETQGSLSEQAADFLGRVRISVKKMSDLIDGLLEFSRTSRQPVQKQLVNIAQIVKEIMESTSIESVGRNIEWTLGELPPCQADPILARQVLSNLIGNAVKFTHKVDWACIEVGSQNGTYYVKDNGAGFDMSYSSQLFKVFQRLHHEDEYKGTGIGLAIVHRIITRHGGRIWAEAAPGKGAVFYFTFNSSPPPSGEGQG